MSCHCGHVEDEHGTTNKKKYPAMVRCLVKGCDCVHFEHNPEADDQDEEEAE